MSKAVIWAKAKLGALLKANPPEFTKGNSGKVKENPLLPGVNKRISPQAQIKFDGIAKSPHCRLSCEGENPEYINIAGFRVKPGMTKRVFFGFLRVRQISQDA